MRKYLRLFLLVAIMFAIVGCGSSKSKVKEAVKKDSFTKSNIQEKVLYDEKDIKVTLTGIIYDDVYGPEIGLSIENNSSKDLTFSAESLAINDIMYSSYFIVDVPMGKKSNKGILLDYVTLKKYDITAIKDIDFKMRAYNRDSILEDYAIIDADLTTDVKNYTQKYNTSGKLVFEKDGVKIYLLGKEKNTTLEDYEINFYIENNSSRDVTVSTTDSSVDGVVISAYLFANVSANKKIYSGASIYESDLTKNKLTDVKSLEAKFTIYDNNDWKYRVTSDPINMKF